MKENVSQLVTEILAALKSENGVTIRITIEPIRQTIPASIKKSWVENEVETILIEKLGRIDTPQIIVNAQEIQGLVDFKNNVSFRRMHVSKSLDKLCTRLRGDYTLSDALNQTQAMSQSGFYYQYPKSI